MHGAADSNRDRPPAIPSLVIDRRFALAAGFALVATCGVLWLAGWYSRGWIAAWPRFADDAFYYLTIAQNVARGHGFTMDQLSATNGFQPLWLWTLVPVARLVGSDPDVFLLVAQGLCVALFSLAGGLLCGLVRARLGFAPALVAGLLIMFPRLENVAVSGLESALLLLILVVLIIEALRSGALWNAEARAADARTGGLVGLLMLARLDSVFIGLTLAGYVAIHGLAHGDGTVVARLSRIVRKELAVFWPAVVLVTPYLAWNLLAFDHLMPISGALKTSFPEASIKLTNLNIEHAGLYLLVFGTVGLEIWRGNGRDPFVKLLALLSIGLVLHALFTVLYIRWGAFSWHFATSIPVGALCAAVLVRHAAARLPRSLVMAAVAAFALFQIAALAISISRLGDTFTVASREAGEWVAVNLPPDAVLGMKDSGNFSYFSRRRVMNLDGVANSFEYANAVCRGRLEDFVRSHGVEYIAQHSVPRRVRIGAYETIKLIYPCHLPGGRDSELVLRRSLEVFRGTPYKDNAGFPDQLFIWRLERR